MPSKRMASNWTPPPRASTSSQIHLWKSTRPSLKPCSAEPELSWIHISWPTKTSGKHFIFVRFKSEREALPGIELMKGRSWRGTHISTDRNRSLHESDADTREEKTNALMLVTAYYATDSDSDSLPPGASIYSPLPSTPCSMTASLPSSLRIPTHRGDPRKTSLSCSSFPTVVGSWSPNWPITGQPAPSRSLKRTLLVMTEFPCQPLRKDSYKNLPLHPSNPTLGSQTIRLCVEAIGLSVDNNKGGSESLIAFTHKTNTPDRSAFYKKDAQKEGKQRTSEPVLFHQLW